MNNTEQNTENEWHPWWVHAWRWTCTWWQRLYLDIWLLVVALTAATLFALAHPNDTWFLQTDPPGQKEAINYGDVAELLIIPLTLAVVAYGFSSYQRRKDREIAAEQRQQDLTIAEKERETDREIAQARNEEAELQTYFDRMSELMLEYKLRPWVEHQNSEQVSHFIPPTTDYETARTIARARTLTVLRRIKDPVRKGSVVRFLYENGLIYKGLTVVDLKEADLNRVNLQEANLHRANLDQAFMQEANLNSAQLHSAHLTGARLEGALLYYACLINARLQFAVLNGAHLDRAFLGQALLHGANLDGTSLNEANLSKANLKAAWLDGVSLNGANLQQAELQTANLGRATTDENTNFRDAYYNNLTIPPPGGLPGAINVDKQGEDEETE